MKIKVIAAICFFVLSSCGAGSDSGSSGGQDSNSSGVFIDSIEFIGANNYCCWTSPEHTFYTSGIKNSNGSSSDPTYMKNAPDGQYAILLNNGYGLITGTNALAQAGVKVHIASGSSGEYEIWGGATIPTEICSTQKPGLDCGSGIKKLAGDPLKYGFNLLGQGSATKEYLGQYVYYIIKSK